MSLARKLHVIGKAGPFALPRLPYEENALSPVISGTTMSFHYGHHHRTYVGKLNDLVEGTAYAGMSLEEIVRKTRDGKDDADIFNNAAQAWNHTFFWSSLTPQDGKQRGKPRGELGEAIDRDFGGFEKFKKAFVEAGAGQFGSGWVWLVADGMKLSIQKTANAHTPMEEGKACLLTVDVWEHAYYLDYQHKRKEFLDQVVAKCLDWEFASDNYARV